MTAAACAYTAMGLIIAGCAFYAWAGVTGREQPVRAAVTRARWAWACRKPPARTEGKLSPEGHRMFTGIVETWRQTAAPERTRT